VAAAVAARRLVHCCCALERLDPFDWIREGRPGAAASGSSLHRARPRSSRLRTHRRATPPPTRALSDLQAFSGETLSEGGFAPNRVAAASLLDVSESTDKKGKKYYRYEVLNRSADGDEGGRHQLISASVSGGKLWICKVQIGDKRWIKGASKDAIGAINSFTVA
jgi:hypothetical protein